jgi:paired amphipathic helix protein Sin3a
LPTQKPDFDASSFETVNNLECKICVNTYKMFFVENTEDSFRRRRRAVSAGLLERRQRSHYQKFSQWLQRHPAGLPQQERDAAQERFDKWFLSGVVSSDATEPKWPHPFRTTSQRVSTTTRLYRKFSTVFQ